VLPGKNFTLDDITQILKKRWWLIALPFALGSVGGYIAYQSIAEQYRSETLIMVVPQRVPDAYVRSTVTGSVTDRLITINEQILSRSRLERVITDFDLYRDLRKGGIMEDVVAAMRLDVDIDPPSERNNTFRVSYSSSDPVTAQKVTERLASLFIEENLRDRESLAENTSLFLNSQLEEAKRQLVAHEKKLEAYQKRNAGTLPSQVTSNMQAISNAQMQLQSLTDAVNRNRERRLLLERQLADLETMPVALLPGLGPEAAQKPTAAQQLQAAREQLEVMKQRFKPDHPDVRAAERLIRDLKVKADVEALQAKLNPNKPVVPSEVARQKRMRDLKDEIGDIDRQNAGSEKEVSRIRSMVADYQARIDVVPTRESELIELTRDYETLRQTYTSLLTKQEDSKLAANLERGQIGEQFRVLDPASLPERPFNEKKRLTMGIGLSLGGLGLGLLIIAALEYRDSSFKTEEDVMRVLSLPVLALVPVLGPPVQAANRRRTWRSALGLSALLLAVAGATAMAFWTR
jgi:polysaccharide chain length determinant protein (PEP-CTERM system associated)